ncbi:hypothetical protein [Haliangium ochraceum]|nr:hypothetical protein [Haliangium ochraceum]
MARSPDDPPGRDEDAPAAASAAPSRQETAHRLTQYATGGG